MFIKHLKSDGITALLIYVDNIIVIGDDEKKINSKTISGKRVPNLGVRKIE